MGESFEERFSRVENSPNYEKTHRVISAPELPSDAEQDVKQEALCEAIRLLSQPDETASMNEGSIQSFAKFFTTLYGERDEFRHMYSDVCRVMYEYLQYGKCQLLDDGVPPQTTALCNNLFYVVQGLCRTEGFSDKVRDKVIKLYDHVELERTRMSYNAVQNIKVNESSVKVEEASRQVEKAVEESKCFQDVVENSKRDSVTILGIFAAIVITFTAGSAFSASVLQNIDAVSIYRLSFVVLALGFFLFNIVAILLVFIRKVSKIGDDSTLLKIVKWTDIIFVTLIVFVVIARFVNLLAIFPVP